MANEKYADDQAPGIVQLNDDRKIQVLISQMNERCQAWHRMRDRSMQFTLWILGLSIAASWKLLQGPCVDKGQKAAVTALVVLLGYAAFHFLKSLANGARADREVLINAETALGLYDYGAYLQGKSLLPSGYKLTKNGFSAHFNTLYILLLVTSAFLLSIVWVPWRIISN